jgi:predicted DNA repair protein MutK
MNDLLRSFGRALASALHPRMLWLTFVPFFAATVVWGVILWFSWQTLTGTTRIWLESWSFTTTLYHLFDWLGFSALHAVLAPFIVIRDGPAADRHAVDAGRDPSSVRPAIRRP